MSNKLSPKNFAIACHRLAVMSDLQLDTINIIKPETEHWLRIRELLVELVPLLDEVVEGVFQVEEVRNGRYMQELSYKVDSVLKKNYQYFPESEEPFDSESYLAENKK